MKAKIESIGIDQNIVGIDISNETFDACFLINNKAHYNKFDQNLEGYSSFLNIYKMLKCDFVGFESTGVYHKEFQKYLIENDIFPHILSPRRVHHFLKSQKRIVGKTDKSDSYGIALYLTKNDDGVTLDFPIREKFKVYSTSLNLYEKQIRQTRNLIHSLKKRSSDDYLLTAMTNMVEVLEFQRDELKQYACKELYSDFPFLKLIRDDIKGIGDGVLFAVVPLIIDHFDKFTMNQIISFIGISPVPFESGSSVRRGTHISHYGDNLARKALFMSAVSSVRNNPIIKEKYLRLVDLGMIKKKALVVIMSHILRLIVSRLSYHTGRTIKK